MLVHLGRTCLALLLISGAARAEDLNEAAKRVAGSLAKQVDKAGGHGAQLKAVALAPLKETGTAKGGGAGKRFTDALAAALGAGGRFTVRDFDALSAAQKERALAPAQGKGDLGISGVQGLIVGEAAGGEAGAPVRIEVRIIAVATGLAVASESAQLGAPPAAVGSAAPPRPRNVIESASVDVAMRKIADQLVLGFQRLPGNARYRRLAVLPFTETGSEAKKRELGAVVTAELSTSLRRDHDMLLVERARLAEVMGEIRLGQSGAVDAASAPQIGKLSDAQALVMGSVAEAGDRYLIDARIVSTESAESLAAASESVAAANLVAVSSDAVVLRSKKDAVFRSVLIPGWGQIYNREPAKGYVFLGSVLLSAGAAISFQLLGSKAEQDYKNASPDSLGSTPEARQSAAEALRTKAEARYTARNIALGVGGSLWLLNIFDAYFSGVDGDKLLGAGFSAQAGKPERRWNVTADGTQVMAGARF